MIKTYRKTVTIKAEQFDGTDEMISRLVSTDYVYPNTSLNDRTNSGLQISTNHGLLRLKVGDWIATGINGEHWAIADDVFKKTYAELPAIPKDVGSVIEDCKKKYIGIEQPLAMVYEYQITRTQSDGVYSWIMNNVNEFVRAWLDGYQVEEDK